jgi:hypothetical protein
MASPDFVASPDFGNSYGVPPFFWRNWYGVPRFCEGRQPILGVPGVLGPQPGRAHQPGEEVDVVEVRVAVAVQVAVEDVAAGLLRLGTVRTAQRQNRRIGIVEVEHAIATSWNRRRFGECCVPASRISASSLRHILSQSVAVAA